MNKALQENLFFVKEHTGIFKAANNFDILNPHSQQTILECREDQLGTFTKIFRFTGYKRFTPFDIKMYTPEPEKKLLLRIKRGVGIFVSKVEIFGENGELLGYFEQKFWSLGGKFNVFDANGHKAFTLQGKWTGWEFKAISDEKGELATVSKKWAGTGKELFTSADNYMLEIFPNVGREDTVRPLIVSAVMCIDMVLKGG